MMALPIGWLVIAVVAYFFHAIAVILDKFILTRRIQRPSTYAFWVGVFGLFALWLAPFDFYVPSTGAIVNAFISGAAFTFGLFFFYIAIRGGETTRIAPVIGGLSPVFVFLLSRGLLGETLSGGELMAFIILIAGSILISVSRKSDGGEVDAHDVKILGWIVLASFLFAVTYVFQKAVFNEVSFINGFIWTRFGGFFGALPFLVFSYTRHDIFEAPKTVVGTTIGAFLAGKIAGAAGFFLVSFAISIAPSVSLVNALQGVEYALVFILALFLSRTHPFILEEQFTPRIIFEKTFAILLIAGGLAVLAFQ